MANYAKGPRYFPSKGGYYVTYQGKRYCLAAEAICPDCAARDKERLAPTCDGCKRVWAKAVQRWSEIYALGEAEGQQDNMELWVLLEKYLAYVKGNLSAGTYKMRKQALQAFADRCGLVRVKELNPAVVNDFLAKMREPHPSTRGRVYKGWSPSVCALFIQSLSTAITWGRGQRLIVGDPLRGPDGKLALKRPRAGKRGNAALVTEADFFTFCRHQSPASQLVLKLLWNTGARPGEIYHATADDWNDELQAFVYHPDRPNSLGWKFKTAYAAESPRVVYVTDAALLADVRRAVAERPSGALFLTDKGELFSTGFYEVERRRLAAMGIKGVRWTPYGLRHTWITRMATKGGMSIYEVADWCGTSVAMIERHYGHLWEHRHTVKDKVRATMCAPVEPDRQTIPMAAAN